MIQATALRVGNWLNDTKPFQVDASDILTISRIPLLGTEEKVKKERLESLYKPIPITPEILEKCGFDKNGFIRLSNRLKLEWSFGKDFWLDKEGDTLFTFEGIEYLHQLQNLYFALTGEELNVNLLPPNYVTINQT